MENIKQEKQEMYDAQETLEFIETQLPFEEEKQLDNDSSLEELVSELSNLSGREMIIQLSYPMVNVSRFKVLKQLSISWKLEKMKSIWTVYIQLLYFKKDPNKESSKDRLYVRYIWSKEGKFHYKLSPFFTPTTLNLLNKFAEFFKFTSDNKEDIFFPYNYFVKK